MTGVWVLFAAIALIIAIGKAVESIGRVTRADASQYPADIEADVQQAIDNVTPSWTESDELAMRRMLRIAPQYGKDER